MARTQVKSNNILDGGITIDDLCTNISGKSVITKLALRSDSNMQGLSCTGADSGTGVVSIGVSANPTFASVAIGEYPALSEVIFSAVTQGNILKCGVDNSLSASAMFELPEPIYSFQIGIGTQQPDYHWHLFTTDSFSGVCIQNINMDQAGFSTLMLDTSAGCLYSYFFDEFYGSSLLRHLPACGVIESTGINGLNINTSNPYGDAAIRFFVMGDNLLLRMNLTSVSIWRKLEIYANGYSPIYVNNQLLCVNVNADLLDGLHSHDFIKWRGASETEPSNPADGDMYYDPTQKAAFLFLGDGWCPL